MFLSLGVFLWAVVGLIRPELARLPNRASSVGVWILSVVLLSIGGALMPDDETPSVASTPTDGQEAVTITGAATASAELIRSAEQGDVTAQIILGGMYDTGRGVPQDDGEAARWFRRAAEQDHALAQYNLGLKYYSGEGVPQDDGEATRWFRRAAEQGHVTAQYNLGGMYYDGRGVPQDDVAAHMWANLADDRGHEPARELLDVLAEEMSAEQIDAAQRAARDWRRVPQAAPCIPTELSPAAAELVRLYEELHTFNNDPQFLRVGFVRGGPYSAWMQAIEKQRDANEEIEFAAELGFGPVTVLVLGMNYMDEDFSESDLQHIEDLERDIQAGLASARCTELGSVQETIQAASEARQLYAAETEAQIVARESLLGRPLTGEELALERLRDTLEAGEEYPGQRAEQTALAKLRPLVARMGEIGEQRKREYDAALARFAAAVAAAEQGHGTYTASLAAGEALLALATEIAAEMSALATELAAVEATAPPTVVALGAPHLIAMEQAEIFESTVAGLQDQLVLMRALAAELAELEQLRR